MKQTVFFDTQIEVDDTATERWYRHAFPWNCDCAHCRNFLAAAKARLLPAELLQFLDLFAIPPEKAYYVCMIPLCDTDWREHGCYYMVNYRLSGRIVGMMKSGKKRDMEFSTLELEPFWEPGFPEPHFDLRAFVTIPWILVEDPDVIS